MKDSLKMTLIPSNTPKKSNSHVINGMSMFCFLNISPKNSNCVRFLCYFVERLFLGAACSHLP